MNASAAVSSSRSSSVLNAAVIVSALGYFVDIYDLILFSIVRVPSLKSMGFEGDALFANGVLLINMQMIGMLVGGLLWGMLGDRRGRLSVLFGSIILYSLANAANGLVQSLGAYAALRFVAGVGLAGELGAGITLVSEVLPKEKRGYGTTIVASVGICGALLAANIAERFDWRVAYFIGGGLGLMLLILRIAVFESEMFERARKTVHRRGDFRMLFKNRGVFFKYLHCILIGVPIWYVIGILMTFSPEFGQALGVTGPVSAGSAIMYSYLGLAIGDGVSGLTSQLLRSRRKVVALFLTLLSAFVVAYLLARGATPERIYALCLALGFGSGYWAIFVTIGAEQFGTNMRATVATTVPNFVRGSVVPLTFTFALLKGAWGILPAAAAVGVVVLAVAFFSMTRLEETFGKDLNYYES